MGKKGTPIDTSSLIYLAKASGLAAANACVGPLLLPPAVWREAVQAGEARGDPEVHRVVTAESSGWVSRIVLGWSATPRRAGTDDGVQTGRR